MGALAHFPTPTSEACLESEYVVSDPVLENNDEEATRDRAHVIDLNRLDVAAAQIPPHVVVVRSFVLLCRDTFVDVESSFTL
jgi:hypothetical protein